MKTSKPMTKTAIYLGLGYTGKPTAEFEEQLLKITGRDRNFAMKSEAHAHAAAKKLMKIDRIYEVSITKAVHTSQKYTKG